MSSTARYVSGDCRPIAVKCDPNYPIEVGDLLFLEPAGEASTGLARPAGAWSTRAAQALNQGAFHDCFLGVALQRNGLQPNEAVPLNSTLNHSPANVIECATAGDFLFPCAADRLEHRRPGRPGEQRRRHGPAEPGRDRGRRRGGVDRPRRPRQPTRSASA